MENEEIIELYKQYHSCFEKLAKKYKGKFELEFEKANRTVVREELSSGSDMTLGYYGPSPVEDLLIGNVHRGKILKRVTKRSKPDTKYGFSEDGKMAVFINRPFEEYAADIRGFVLYENNVVTYVSFQKFEDEAEPEWIAQVEYDEQRRIIRYTLGLFIGFHCSEIQQEIYTYSDEGMKYVVMWDYLRADCISQINFLLHHDKDGYLTGYEDLDSDFWNGHIFEITPSKRRKI
jgi:hypothetical protein